MERVSVMAITRNGVGIGRRLKEHYPGWEVLAPEKLADGGPGVSWFRGSTPEKVGEAFRSSDALVCLFSLGAVIRLAAPHMRDKKTDPAVLVIDDGAGFVISALSGHLGGANQLAREVAEKLGAVPVITTAADVNSTISVDLLGREFGWEIEDGSPVTAASAAMVNGDSVGVFQDAGRRDWWPGRLPGNVTVYGSVEELEQSGSRASLVITDRAAGPEGAVVYRPKTLVVGVGLHRDTASGKIKECISECLRRFSLSPRSVARLASVKKPAEVAGLAEFAAGAGIPLEYVERSSLAGVEAPNPSETVRSLEGTASVAEAAAILVSGGSLVVEKQKFPPDLTVAVARMPA